MTTPTPLPHAVAIQMCSDFDEGSQSCGDPNHSPESCTCLKLSRAWRKMESDLASAQEELERERMRLVACGVVAMANTPESAADARQIHEDYRSASLSDVERAVNAEMKLRTDLAAAQEARERAEARVKSLVLDLSAAIGRYQRAEERAAQNELDAERYRKARRNGGFFFSSDCMTDEEIDAKIDALTDYNAVDAAREPK